MSDELGIGEDESGHVELELTRFPSLPDPKTKRFELQSASLQPGPEVRTEKPTRPSLSLMKLNT